jgi:hypothetical protein
MLKYLKKVFESLKQENVLKTDRITAQILEYATRTMRGRFEKEENHTYPHDTGQQRKNEKEKRKQPLPNTSKILHTENDRIRSKKLSTDSTRCRDEGIQLRLKEASQKM